MNKPCFTSADFEGIEPSFGGVNVLSSVSAAYRANALLQERGERAYSDGITWSKVQRSYDTHAALLICEEPLAKVECEHDGYLSTIEMKGIQTVREEYTCRKCYKKLKPKWEAAE